MNARFAPIYPADPEPRAPLSMIPNFGHLGSPRAMSVEPAPEPESSAKTISLKLGEATVDVEYEMVAGCVYVQGATVHGEWVDVDLFAKGVGANWRRAIERSLGMGQ